MAQPLRIDQLDASGALLASAAIPIVQSGATSRATPPGIFTAAGIPSVTDPQYGASTTASAADNTTAFNAALTAHSVVFVPGNPGDVYDLNALTALTTSKIIYGNGATLRFNTTGDGLTFSQASSAQNKIGRVIGLQFDNVTNTPASYIKNDGFLNFIVEKCQFTDCAATYCVDNVKGYGITIRDCVFADVTGGAIILRDDGATLEYSYVARIENCDITRPSGVGITVEGCQVLRISGTTIETCGGKGVLTATAGGSIQAWDIHFDNCYFEGNTGTDVDLGTDGSNYWSTAVFTACTFVGTPTVALGAKSKATFVGCNNTGGNAVTVTGSSNAEAYFVQSTNFTQSGTFAWWADTPTVAFTPTVTNVTTSTATGQYTRHGALVTAHYQIVVSAQPTGNVTVTLPVTAANNTSNAIVGTAVATDVGTSYFIGAPWLVNSTTVQFHAHGSGSEWNATVPHTWASGDKIDFFVTYSV